MFQTNVQSQKMTMFGSFRYSVRKNGVEVSEGREMLTDELDAIIETDEDVVKYGSNTEFDAEDFSQELFGSIMGDAEEVKSNEWAVAQREIGNLDEIRKLKRICEGDPDLSIMATSYVLNSMSEEIANVISEYRAYAEDPDSPTDQNGNPDPDQFSPSAETTGDLITKAKSLQELVDELSEMDDLMDAMGSKDCASQESDEVNRRDLVDQLRRKNSVLRKVMSIVGRLRNAVSGLSANSIAEQLTDTEIVVGRGKLNELLSSEKMYLADVEMQDIFYDRWIKRNQLKFQKKGKSKKIGGPITILVDESGSMDGNREEIAKSVAAALFGMAHEQNRDVTVIGFDHGINYTMKLKKRAKRAQLGNGWRKIKDLTVFNAVGFIANRKTYGGTCFVTAIDKGLRESKGKNADILFITDGEDRIESSSLQKLLKSKEKDGTRIFTILLGCSNQGLRSVSDAVLPFNRLTEKNINSLAGLMKLMER